MNNPAEIIGVMTQQTTYSELSEEQKQELAEQIKADGDVTAKPHGPIGDVVRSKEYTPKGVLWHFDCHGSSLALGSSPDPSAIPESMRSIKDVDSFRNANARHFWPNPEGPPNYWWATPFYMGPWMGTDIPSLLVSMNRTAAQELQESNPNIYRMIQTLK
ncbi:MAG: hypothetical protein ABW007_19175 [Chitinophagaceae bacterium]